MCGVLYITQDGWDTVWLETVKIVAVVVWKKDPESHIPVSDAYIGANLKALPDLKPAKLGCLPLLLHQLRGGWAHKVTSWWLWKAAPLGLHLVQVAGAWVSFIAEEQLSSGLTQSNLFSLLR